MKLKLPANTAYLTSVLMIALIQSSHAAATELKWTQAAGNDTISTWLRKVVLVIMAIFTMVAVVLGSLAFKQLSADGNWKDFWSKIAGAIGMFVVPIAVWWATTA